MPQQRPRLLRRAGNNTQLSLTNLRDAFIGQSRSSNIVSFHMLDIVSYCAIVTLSLKTRRFFTIFDFKKCRDLEMRSLKVIESGTIRQIVYGFLLLFFSTVT